MSYNGSPPPWWGDRQPPDTPAGRAEDALRAYADIAGRERAYQEYMDQVRAQGERGAEEWARQQAAQAAFWQQQQAAAAAAARAAGQTPQTPGAAEPEPQLIVVEGFKKTPPRADQQTGPELSSSVPTASPPPARRSRGGLVFVAILLVLGLVALGFYQLHQSGVKKQEARMIQSLNNVTCVMTRLDYPQLQDWQPLPSCDTPIKQGKAKEITVVVVLRDLRFQDFEGSGWTLTFSCPCKKTDLTMGGAEVEQDSILPYAFYVVLTKPGKYAGELVLTDNNHERRAQRKLALTVDR